MIRPAPLVALLAATALAACGGNSYFNRDPDVSSMALDGEIMPEARVSVPMPAPEPPRQKFRAEGASLWQRGSGGFFADQRATQVGDILTIMIEIDDEAALQNATTRSREGGGTLAAPEVFGMKLPASGEVVDITSTQTATGSGQINRRESISLRVAALVVQELPNGNFVVAGRQEVKVNQELRELRVAGIIRPQDIQMNNTIPYEKIAEARITYGGRGQISRQQQRSYGEDIMDIILPY